MRFRYDLTVDVNSIENKDEATAFLKFLFAEKMRHLAEVRLISRTMNEVARKWDVDLKSVEAAVWEEWDSGEDEIKSGGTD